MTIDATLRGLGYPFDVIVISSERFEASKNVIGGEWVRKADQDIRAAETLLLQDPPLLYPVPPASILSRPPRSV